jgi:regulator of RNase E activity RraB
MSTKELLEEANKLLASNWEDHEKELVKRMIDSLVAYKSLIPKSLKNDVKAMLQMANRIKTEYDELLKKYKDEKKESEEQDNKQDDKDEVEIIN